MTIFVLTTDDNVLHVFASEAAALTSDAVKANMGRDDALFFADDGSGLRHDRVAGADYLRPWASCSSCSLPQVLHLVSAVVGASPLDSLEAVARYTMR
ncbi:hypothetical protein VVD49_15330 [Uliginosibacterium sp. H3]|uniref:Uncharacterized protein n=1 Tax=Uliginosibacterium silvisoli TaxID=3114758 RepID=A0ABU6K5U5_9RHOO|nr:hypothetical protein [Uliginosibacterium sp. H3]